MDLQAVNAKAWLAWLYLTFFGSLLAYSSYTWLVKNTSAALVSTHAYVNPVVAVALGALWGGEKFGPATALAAAVTIMGVVLLMLPERRNRPALATVTSPSGGRRHRACRRHASRAS